MSPAKGVCQRYRRIKCFSNEGTAKFVISINEEYKTNSGIEKKSSYRYEDNSNVDWDKYKNAKSISSDQLFGTDETSEYDKQKLSQYSNATAIGSDDFFGESQKKEKSISQIDEWNSEDFSRMASNIKDTAIRMAQQAKTLFDDF